MTISARSALMAGLATVTASAVLIAPSVQPLPPPKPAIQLAASSVTTQPLAQPADYFSDLFEWWQVVFQPSASRPFPQPPTVPLPTPGSIPSALEGAYHAIEPWVRYGFELAQYAVGWVPYVGWLSGQIMIFYNFGERIVHAIAHNTLDWLNGNGSFAQNLGEGIRWSIDALIQLGIDEWNYFLPPLPPLPPIPCIVFCRNLSEFNAPLNDIRVGLRDTVTGLLQQLSAIIPGTHDPDEPDVGLTADVAPDLATRNTDPVAEVSRVPQTIIHSLNPAAAAQDEVTGTVSDVQPPPRKSQRLLASLVELPGNVVKGVTQGQNQAKGAAADATDDDAQATVGRAHGPVRDAVANTATTVTKRVTETARDVASTVKKATNDPQHSIKKADDNQRTSAKKTKADDK